MASDALSTLESSLSENHMTFERSLFLDTSFSPVVFLAERQHVALDKLKGELLLALKDLKTELVELINRDYADFINLSTNLVGVDKMIVDLKSPLDKMKNDVKTIQLNLQRVLDELESKLEMRSLIREKKTFLQLFLGIHESVVKIEEMLNIANREETYSPTEESWRSLIFFRVDSLGDDGKLIERVAIEYNQLQYLVTRGKGTSFVANIDWRIIRIKETLTSSLSRALKSSLNSVMNDPSDSVATTSLSQYLRTYVLIDKLKEAEEAFRSTIITPFMQKTISRKSLEFNPTNTPVVLLTEKDGSLDFSPLRDMYFQVIKFISEKCDVILQITRKVFRGTNYDFLRDVVWEELVTAIVKNIPTIFNPGIPEIFHRNYIISIQFVSEFEALCKTKQSVILLRSHPSYIDFLKRWQLAVYFQIRLKEITTDFENGLLTDSDNQVSQDERIPLSDF
ncbi:Conserved oligomeric Golgi complex subunit 2, partial [Nowakowskiella sp. JEL0078]